MAGPLLLGHRGARNYAPENTIAAFELALEHGCDGFEFDVRLTADFQAVICHDQTYNGLCVAESTYEQLTGDVLEEVPSSRGLPAVAEPMPLLEDVLEGFASRAWLDVELKVPGLEALAIDLFQLFQPERFLISSFLPDVLSTCAAMDGTVPLGFICDKQETLELWTEIPASVILPHRRLVTQELIEEMRVAGKRVMVWTVNDEREMLRFSEWGVDGLISDDTRLLGSALHRARG